MIISVTGGAQDFQMRPRLEKVIKDGILKAAVNGDAWIMTGGTDTGVMKYVGEAIGESAVPLIGFVSWGVISHREELIVKDHSRIDTHPYQKKMSNSSKNAALDPNHTHFVLVDDGTTGQWGKEIQTRTKFEQSIAHPRREWRRNEKNEWIPGGEVASSNLRDIPIVCIVIQGGPGTFKTAHESKREGTPVVTIDQSGNAADVIAYAWNHVHMGLDGDQVETVGSLRKGCHCIAHDHYLAEKERVGEMGVDWRQLPLCSKIRSMLLKTFTANNSAINDNMTEWIQRVSDTVMEKERVVIYKLSDTSTEDVSYSILKAILQNNVSFQKKLEYAIHWRRDDVAKSEVLLTAEGTFLNADTMDPQEHSNIITQSFQLALSKDSPEMAKLLIDCGADIKGVNLSILYKDSETVYLRDLCTEISRSKKKEWFEPEVIHVALKRILGSLYKGRKKKGVGQQVTYMDLLMWCALTHRVQLCHYIWTKVVDPLEGALVAAHIWRFLASSGLDGIDLEMQEQLRHDADIFEDLATNTLDALFDNNSSSQDDEELAIQTVLTPLSSIWTRRTTVIELAVESNSKKFVSHRCVQAALNRRWTRPLPESTTNTKVALVTILPFFLLFMPGLQVSDVGNMNAPIEHAKSRQIHWDIGYYARCYIHFYQSAVAKFWVQTWMYLAFLGLYSYVVLYAIDGKTHITPLEILVAIWIFSFALDELQQLRSEGFAQYTASFWNRVDMLMISIYVAAFLVRIALPGSGTGSDVTRMLMGVDAVFFYCRLMNRFSVDRNLGPLVATIGNMATDIFLFLFILLVVILGFGISFYASLFTHDYVPVSDGENLGDLNPVNWVIQHAYWQIYGQLFLSEFQAAKSTFTLIPKILLAIYLIVANVLLVNLLIAMMSDTYQKMSEQSKEVWRFMRYGLIKEFEDRPMLPPPISAAGHFYNLIEWCVLRILNRQAKREIAEAKLDEDGYLDTDSSKRLKESKQALKLARANAMRLDGERVAKSVDRRIDVAIQHSSHLQTMIQEDRDLAEKKFKMVDQQLSELMTLVKSGGGAAAAAASSSSSSPAPPPSFDIVVRGVKVPILRNGHISEDTARLACETEMFKSWGRNLDSSLVLKSVLLQDVDKFGPRVGFIKFTAEIKDAQGAAVPGIVFMRGGAVAILPILHCEGTRYTLLTVQARVPIASAAFAEIPAGMLDGKENFAGVAAKELEEETGMTIKKSELIDLSGLAIPGSSGMFPSPGGCDEFIRLYAFERIVSLEQLREMQGKLTGQLLEGEKITLKVVKLENIPIETPDAKALSALQLYTYLVAAGKIRPLV
eukprot:TRINITY_DN128_c0_g2_i1.p1 TRINITY_DN128_c0_g2~~TRINITY_DN128_c0_g2_i1.p1  ORF type:complete len:1464 (-),score=371.71 TRINITY_DN128_c0_g2_i1:13-3942(-)